MTDVHTPSQTQVLDSQALYFNRELSLLAFNERVLDLAEDDRIPLLERLRYICIASSNMDEFIEVRFAAIVESLKHNVVADYNDGHDTRSLYAEASARMHTIIERQYHGLQQDILPSLQAENIFIIRRQDWTKEQQQWLAHHFKHKVMPLVTPLGLDPAHPFPNVLNKSLNFIVQLDGTDAFGRHGSLAVVQAPQSIDRVVMLPEELCNSINGDKPKQSFVLLSAILHHFISKLFPGMSATGCHQFRVTRNSNMYVAEEDTDDLLTSLEGELPMRNYGQAVRLEVAENCPEDIYTYLLQVLNLPAEQLFKVDGPVNLNRLSAIYDQCGNAFDEHKFKPHNASLALHMSDNIFKQIRQQDVLMHHPYQSFNTYIDFLSQASRDPKVLAIRHTLYRTKHGSEIVRLLCDAAKRGKDVSVVVELKARFDEAHNIQIVNQMQTAGVHVVYGVVNHKTHAKLALVVRQEGHLLRRYSHIGTGNYHENNARFYTDFGILTANKKVGVDVHNQFRLLTSLGKFKETQHMLNAPFTLHNGMLSMINAEAKNAKAGLPARIIAKMNALVDEEIIQALYLASAAGVKIDLIVRGVCCLIPQAPGLSENIKVRSIMGQYLEHSRVYHFQNNASPVTYIASADWMPRNFFRRIEVALPILDEALQQRVLEEGLLCYLDDNSYTWQLQPDGRYHRLYCDESTGNCQHAQQQLRDKHTAN